jgi:predicted nicotinamide N-methyase
MASTVTCLTHTAFLQEWTVLQQLSSMDHAFSLWDSALHFVRFLEANSKEVVKLRGKRVLEVGAGTGLVGMVLAEVAQCLVTCTDLPHVLPNLRSCFRVNGFVEDAGGVCRRASTMGTVTAAAYGWGDDMRALLASYGPFDVIVGTDVVYSEYLVPALLRSVATAALASEGRLGGLAPKWDGPFSRHCVVYFANEVRSTLTHEIFCATSERYFRMKQIKQSRYHADSKDSSLHIFELRVRTDGALRPPPTDADTSILSNAAEMTFADGVAFHLCLLPGDSISDTTDVMLTDAAASSAQGRLDSGVEPSAAPSATGITSDHRRNSGYGAGSATSRNPLHMRASGLDRTLLPDA